MPENGNGTAPERDDEEQQQTENDEHTPLLKSTDRNDRRVGASSSTSQGQGEVLNAPQEEEDDEVTIVFKETSFTKLALILGSAFVGVFLAAVDTSIIATLVPAISSEFNSLSLLSWLATSYLISSSAIQPLSGRLTDIFGRGPGLVWCLIMFSIGNIICGLSKTENVMIIGRIVSGFGGGGIFSITTFLASDMIPLRQRGIVQGIGNLCFGSGSMLGGVFGGLINDHTKLGWRLAFLVQAPPVLLAAIAVGTLVKIPPKQSNKSYLARIDFGGVFLTTSFLVLFLVGVNSGGNTVPWLHPLTLSTIPLSIILFCGFWVWESKARQPIVPVRLLLDRTVFSACITNLWSAMVVIAGMYYVPLYIQVLGHSATRAGIQLLPAQIGVSLSTLGSGYMIAKTGRYMGIAISGLVMMVIGSALFTLMDEHSQFWLATVGFFLAGGGYGIQLNTTLLACIASVEHSQQAVVTSVSYLFRTLGATLGLTIASAIYQNTLVKELWKRFGDQPNAADEIRQIRDSLDRLKHLPEGWYEGVIKSFMQAFLSVWCTLVGLSVLGLFSICFMRQHTLHSTLERR